MLTSIIKGAERRAAPLEAYGIPGGGSGWIGFPLYGGRTDAGRLVSPDTAIEAVAVQGAIRLIASAIGSLPLKVYRDADERQAADGSRQWRMLHDTPNDEMAADEFWELVTANLLGWGNAFILKERDSSGIVQNLWPIRSSRVQVGRTNIRVGGQECSVRYFTVTGVDGPIYETDILHIRGLSFDGQVGFSPVQLARQEIANALEMDTFKGSFWRNGMFAGGMLTHPNRLSKDAQDRLAAQISAKSGTSRAGELLVLEEGMTLQNLTIPLADAQYVEQAKLSDLRIAQLFGLVPPHLWGAGENSRTMNYQNSEFGGQEFVKWTARPWLIRIEKAVQRDQGIFPSPGPTLVPEFDTSELLRADTQARWNTYAVGFGKWIDAEWVAEQEHIDLEGRTIEVAAAAEDPMPTSPTVSPPPEPEPGDRLREQIAEWRAADERRDRERRDDLRDISAKLDKPTVPPQITVNNDQAQIAEAITRVSELVREVADKEISAPQVKVDARQDAPVVNVDMAALASAVAAIGTTLSALKLPTPQVTVNVPEQQAPVVNVNLAQDEPEQMQIDFNYGPNGRITGATVTDG